MISNEPTTNKPSVKDAPSREVSLTFWQGKEEIRVGKSGLPLEIGRQLRNESEADLLKVRDRGDHFRLAIAPIVAVGLPRQALRVTLTDAGQLACLNVHTRSTFHVAGEKVSVLPGQRALGDGELIILLPENLTIQITLVPPASRDEPESVVPESNSFRTISPQSPPPETPPPDFTLPTNPGASFIRTFGVDSDTQRGHAAVDLVRQALAVVKKSAGSDEFFDTAVRSVAKMVELDRAYVLMLDTPATPANAADLNQSNWSVKAYFVQSPKRPTNAAAGIGGEFAGQKRADEPVDGPGVGLPGGNVPLPSGSRLLLQRIVQKRQTVIYEPESYPHTVESSIMQLDRAVASPIFDERGTVIGALYGDRTQGSQHADTPIGDLEATLLEVMTGAVAAGIVRQRHEAIQTSMTQFFSPAVTQRLRNNEDLLSGRDVEVSVLFCDIRGFSAITERVGPEKTIEWINDVLTQLSLCVVRTDGVLVDYVGDELMAMWGAPAEQPDHAHRACTAACQMLQQIEPLRERWIEITPEKFGVGIGINTGIARVGNTGSTVKFKYGPLGNTVNLASRVQGITKKLGVSAIITRATRDALHEALGKEISPQSRCDKAMQTRRLATVRPLGVREVVELHELQTGEDPQWRSMADRYESALESFHRSDLTAAARELASLVHEHPHDSPSVVLLGRVVDAITHRTESVNPIMELTSK